ncbi:MAG TPA: hypothetical protein VFD97_04850, partial [Acidimicrobiia bacterium]|nr:hypothetical protein [Acidimicrobiia bacterium]
MFKNFQDVFRKSWQAFQAEFERREPEDQVAELLMLMRKELVSARADIPLLLRNAEQTRAALSSERKALDDCRRRREMAERIDDAETVKIAIDFEVRHLERVEMLEQKAKAAEAEHALRGEEADEMTRRYKEADANRFGLLAELRRSAARSRMTNAMDENEGPLSDWARMSEIIDGE